MRRVGGFLLLLGFLSGCSIYTALPLPRYDLSRSPHRGIDRGRSVLTIVQPLDFFEDTNEYFNADLLSAGILPFYVLVLNAGDDPIRLSRGNIYLDFNGQRALTPMPARAVAKKFASSKLASLKLGTMGLVVAFVTDYTRTNDFIKKVFPPTIDIAPHEGIDGVLFFQLADPPRDAFGSKLRFKFMDLRTRENRTINLVILDPKAPLTTSEADRPAD